MAVMIGFGFFPLFFRPERHGGDHQAQSPSDDG